MQEVLAVAQHQHLGPALELKWLVQAMSNLSQSQVRNVYNGSIIRFFPSVGNNVPYGMSSRIRSKMDRIRILKVL